LFIKLLTSTVLIKLLDPEPDPNPEQIFRIRQKELGSSRIQIRIRIRIRNTGQKHKNLLKQLSTFSRYFHNFQHSKGKVPVIAWYLEPIVRNIWTFQIPKTLQQCTVIACSRRLSRYSVTMPSQIQVPLQKWNYKSVFLYICFLWQTAFGKMFSRVQHQIFTVIQSCGNLWAFFS
jgi:hypothetical protein